MNEKYILKYKNNIVRDINKLEKENEYKKPVILYLYNEKNEEILLKNVKLTCYGANIGNVYSTIAININNNKEKNNKEEKLFNSIINDVKTYLKNSYPEIIFKDEYIYKNGFKSMYCKFNKDYKTDEYRTYIKKNSEIEHVPFYDYKEKLIGKIKEVRFYLQLVLILTKGQDNEIFGQLTYNIKQIIFEKPVPKPLF